LTSGDPIAVRHRSPPGNDLRLLYLIFIRLRGWLVRSRQLHPPVPHHPVADLSQFAASRRPRIALNSDRLIFVAIEADRDAMDLARDLSDLRPQGWHRHAPVGRAERRFRRSPVSVSPVFSLRRMGRAAVASRRPLIGRGACGMGSVELEPG
jgi:hypothetical protein